MNIRSLLTEGLLWKFDGYVTQSVDADANIGFDVTIANGQRALLLDGMIGTDDYAAGRTISVNHRLEGGSLFNVVTNVTSVDNTRIYFPKLRVIDEGSTEAVFGSGVPYSPLLVASGESLRINGASLADGETLTAKLRMLIFADKPTVAAFGTNVSLTTTTNKVDA